MEVWPVGYRIEPRALGPSSEMIKAFGGASVSIVADCMVRDSGAVGLSAYHGKTPSLMCGPALTVRVRPGDNLLIHKALSMAEPGDVIVIDGGGATAPALIGGLMRSLAIGRRLAGFVVDGALRDVQEWAEGGVAAFAKAHSYRRPTKDGPGEINAAITCAGMAVRPGDLVMGDGDGVIVIRPEEIPTLVPMIDARIEHESESRKRNLKGQGPGWVDDILRAKGLPI